MLQARKGKQLGLFSGVSVQGRSDIAELRLKQYIQPFERALARAELEGLVPHVSTADPFTPIESSTVTVKGANVERLIKRLAYWEEVVQAAPHDTYQVILEQTASSIKSRRQYRNLRYGTHDIHEYRGKFFPQLVRSLMNYARLPEGALVLDPMNGSGTTNCEARLLGMQTIGLDLNPLSVLIAKAKCDLLSADPKSLETSATRTIQSLEHDLRKPQLPWSDEDYEYLSRWFDKVALDDIARVLAAIGPDRSVEAQFLLICLSNVLRTASWQKNDDLRVRKEVVPYRCGSACDLFKEQVLTQLKKISPFVNAVREGYAAATMPPADIREGDSRIISEVFSQYRGCCDSLITSPPYATALPYLDTDRLSLIVLGLLPRSDHRMRESLMIGNREVTEAQRREIWGDYQSRKAQLPTSVQDLVDRLGHAYHSDSVGFRRRNLPALLAKYFLDMTAVMQSSLSLMRRGAPAFFVVGNNSTRVNGHVVTIETERLLEDVARQVGWCFQRRLNMELLPSRDIFRENRGSAETLLCFTAGTARSALYSIAEPLSDRAEQKRDGSWDFHDEDTQAHLHRLHPYPARFIPQIPRRAIVEYSGERDVVLDPFCGGGTTLLEASMLGRTSIGVDNNAVAHLIACAKVEKYTTGDLCELDQFVRDFPQLVKDAPSTAWSPRYKNNEKWFSHQASRDLKEIRWALDHISPRPRLLAMASFSSIILRASNQDSDTRYAAVERKYTAGSAQRWLGNRIRGALKDAWHVKERKIAQTSVYLADARDLAFLASNSVGLIVTSPPYLNAYDYHKYHRHRLHWLDADIAFARDQEIGKHDEFTRPGAKPDRYFVDMEMCMKEWHRVCRPGANVVLVVGDAIVSGQPIAVGDMLTTIAQSVGFELRERFVRSLLTSRKSFNQGARIDMEHVIVLRRRGSVSLSP